MPKQPKIGHPSEEEWRQVLLGEHPGLYRRRNLYKLIPSSPRCKLCNAPFGSIGGFLMRFVGRHPYSKNPNFCGACLVDSKIGGVEIELSMLFADVRGSTTLAEKMKLAEFSQLMNRFYHTASEVLLMKNALIDKLVGDEIIGLFIPGFSGPHHARLAVEAAEELLRATGYGDADSSWLPLGIGVHTGVAYVGLVGTEGGISDLTALGDAMNTAARLASKAGAGEILISETSHIASGLNLGNQEMRHLELKGKSEMVDARVICSAVKTRVDA